MLAMGDLQRYELQIMQRAVGGGFDHRRMSELLNIRMSRKLTVAG